jgi:ADP-ribose pyrophosphatase
MMMVSWSQDAQESIAAWLERTLTLEDLAQMVPEGDPLRTWWEPEPRATAVRRLVAVLSGGADHLTLLSLVQRARSISPPPAALDELLSRDLGEIARGARRAMLADASRPDTFLSYAHEDTDRAAAIGRLLGSQGVRVFRDVERIRPGESITTQLHQVMSTVDSAVAIISRSSADSEWVDRELRNLMDRRQHSNLALLPVLVDDVPLPDLIADVFTIDLRGYRGHLDDGWASQRLMPLIERLRAGARPRTQNAGSGEGERGSRTMRSDVTSARVILDDVFRVEEALVSYERFDGTMSPVVRRLSLDRGDSVAAMLVNRRLGTVMLVRQFRYPTLPKDSGWTIEAIAGALQPGETPEACMRREIEEETGNRVHDLRLISTFFVSPGGSTERVFLFYADVDEAGEVSTSRGLAAEGEDIEVITVPIARARSMMERGEIADAKTIVGLQWLLLSSPGVSRDEQ